MSENAHDVRDLSLAEQGRRRIEWAAGEMSVLQQINDRFVAQIAACRTENWCCLHVTTETANLTLILKNGGAEIRLCALICSPPRTM